ncbi:hypothetical protein ACFLWX_01345 [Chloroflexota bacterium]
MIGLRMTEEAKFTFNDQPYSVDYANSEGCTGDTWTNPKYRSKGLMKYGYFKRFDYLRSKGIIRTRNVVATYNIVAQRVHTKFRLKIQGAASYLRILRWVRWKEKSLADSSLNIVPPA